MILRNPHKEKKTLSTPDDEALAVAYSEMKVVHGLPTTQKMLGMKLNDMLVGLHPNISRKEPSLLAYSRRVIQRVNANEEDRDRKKKRSSTGEINVRDISHKRA